MDVPVRAAKGSNPFNIFKILYNFSQRTRHAISIYKVKVCAGQALLAEQRDHDQQKCKVIGLQSVPSINFSKIGFRGNFGRNKALEVPF